MADRKGLKDHHVGGEASGGTRGSPRQWSTHQAAWRPRGTATRLLGYLVAWRGWEHRWITVVGILLAIFPLYVTVTTPLNLFWQTVFAVGLISVGLWLRRFQGHIVSVTLIALSMVASTRYIYWRATSTLGFDVQGVDWVDLTFAIVLFAAELYALVVLYLGHFQILWPLERRPSTLPENKDEWPVVDVFIPTYNEPLSVVRPTVLAATDMDWPSDKLNIYILDDGSRDEFRQFAEEANVGYLTRPDSTHAKAGNINQALTKTNGHLITIFDCDHIPCRSFLQVTVGAFIHDDRLSLVQTPHHFFSADPFERNLGTFRSVPNEGELFYGLLQDGNDLWNATFFCGSCAVIRRTALEEVGGVAVETVTEDAHTSLKMHKRGWRSAYINVPQAAGLATDSLSGHVGQRIRWARGMAQIFRVDNPLLASGLKFGQRLCYVNAMFHFFYGFPRMVFLLAPLSYLFLEAHIIQASALLIAAYAAPHLALSTITNSRLQGPYRHSFWAEVYETVLCYYIFLPTLLAVINPKLGKFNVTEKGGINESTYFDKMIARPYVVMLVLNIAGFAVGIGRFFWWNTHEIDTVVLNMLWTIYNIVMLGAASCVAWEAKQVRKTVRVTDALPALLRLPNGRLIACHTADMSEGGAAIELPQHLAFSKGQEIQLAVLPEENEVYLPAEVVGVVGTTLRLRFLELNVQQEKHLVYCIFGRANAWLNWGADRVIDRPSESFYRVIGYGYEGIYRMIKLFFRSLPGAIVGSVRSTIKFGRKLQPQTAAAAIVLALIAAMGLLPAQAAEVEGVRVGTTEKVVAQASIRPLTRTLTFKDLGFVRPIRLRGIDGQVALPLSVRDDEIITDAKLNLRFAHSPALLYELSHLNILVNDELVKTIELSDETADGATASFEVDPRLFVDFNRITLQLIGHYTYDCEDPSHSSLWAIISNESTLTFSTRPLKLANDLSLLPQPFFEERDPHQLELPFVFSSDLSNDELTSAGIVASWFGSLSSYRGASFPVYLDKLPLTHAVVFVNGGSTPAGLDFSQFGDSGIAIVQHPQLPTAKLLVVKGSSGADLINAARALTLGSTALSGEAVSITSFEEPTPREPYDAPRWLPTDRKVELGELVSSQELEVKGLHPDTIRVNFSSPPDLFTWRKDGVPLHLKYRHTPNVAAASTLNVGINDEFVESVSLVSIEEGEAAANQIHLPFLNGKQPVEEKLVMMPDYKIGARNQLQFQFYYERKKDGPCSDITENYRGAIDPDSTIDLQDMPHFVELPQLNLYATSGFPFTRMADLSQTVIVLPDALTSEEISTYLMIMGQFGASTGYPGIRVKLSRAAEIGNYADHDILVLGSIRNQPLFSQWADRMPLSMVGDQPRVRVVGMLQRIKARWDGRDVTSALEHAGTIISDAGDNLAALMSFESPLKKHRTVVALTAGTPERLVEVAELLQLPGKSPFVKDDLILINGDELNHYQVGETYWVGKLPLVTRVYWFFSNQPLIMLVLAVLVCLVLAVMMYRALRSLATRRRA